MGRKRIALSHDVEAAIAARTARGESAETIYYAIGKVISIPTIERRQRELRTGKTKKPPSKPQREDTAPDVPDQVPEDAPLEAIDRWLAGLTRAAAQAEAAQNWTALASISQKVATLMALKHKMTPLPKADLNEHPDYQKLAEEGEQQLLQLARAVYVAREPQI